MRESDPINRAVRAAIARAKRRGDEEVTPDHLLAATLGEVARFGIALVGPWAMDVTDLDGDSTAGGFSTNDGADRGRPASGDAGGPETDATSVGGPRYADATVAVFEEAARLQGQDGSATLRLVHLLAALGAREDGLMSRLRERYGFTPVEWRAALARGELGAAANDEGPHANRPERSGTGTPELLSVDQAASFLGVHAQTVRNYIRAGKLPAYRLAGERFIRVLRRDLLGLLEPVAADDAQEEELDLPVNLSTRE